MKIILLPVILILLAAAVIVVLAMRSGTKGATATYRRRKLMTENEEKFFGRLVAALPDHYVFPQVAMSALIEADASDRKKAHSDRLRIAQQRVDYVVCTRRCEVVAVVELDDRTHTRAKDDVRDGRLGQAGIRTVRFQSRNKPKVDAIRALVLGTGAVEANVTSSPANDQTPAVAAASPSELQ